MINRIKGILIIFFMISSFAFVGCVHARRPKPGPNFVWVPVHVAPGSRVIPAHWKYVGIPHPHGRHWVAGHFKRAGLWVPGHWVVN